MTTIRIKLPKITDVNFTIICEEEDIAIHGNASAIDEQTDKEIERDILRRLDQGDPWAWCRVVIYGEYKSMVESASMGCCIYQDKNDFIKNSRYYEDMKQEVYQKILTTIQGLSK